MNETDLTWCKYCNGQYIIQNIDKPVHYSSVIENTYFEDRVANEYISEKESN